MNLIWTNLRVPVDEDERELPLLMARKLKVPQMSIDNLQILRRSVDARKKPQLFFSYTLRFSLDIPYNEMNRVLRRMPELKPEPQGRPVQLFKPEKKLSHRPIIVGAGPAGYFAALALGKRGYAPIVLERGDDVETRTQKVEAFWKTGKLDCESNVQFGEGGAGTFSDGKLTTRIADPRITEVLETFVEQGAPPEILFLAKAHIGTDRLRIVTQGLRKKIEALGGEVRFRTQLTGLQHQNGRITGVQVNHSEVIPAEAVILAIGHSARETYRFLQEQGVHFESKSFAIGLRVEHPQELINFSQFGVEHHHKLGPADYQLTYQDALTGRGAYAFCMCPGGKVVAAASEEGRVVTNGMSEYRRDSGVANSALVVTVGRKDFWGDDPLAGVEFQQYWEHQAFLAGGKDYNAPAQSVRDFLARRVSGEFPLQSSYAPGTKAVDLHTVLPQEVGDVLDRALLAFDHKIHGFAGDMGTLTGIETRTSAPVRMTRDKTGEALNFLGLFPAGEGAGYAGGIMSAAVDGIRSAEQVMAQYYPAE
ncbi:FAD-dependent dehydrogenase [Desulfitobacterium dichloroeliminans LMG P-21439]|uniref:FAD-dependent dehydrogenase n=1 Tax=Desulfitobacterium dichloroeliminans (strain LMG P-21439 / DCA1) TaxID=871963 RepID=L0F680_DESDL|nr:FAD-dependent oxidoreductase [Desulfitobacterium dichloroeliminans]AGA68151.1 FAD-dependent dehydrogenase [Desulfitobacterium dichloroeliminans LMG P-21439]